MVRQRVRMFRRWLWKIIKVIVPTAVFVLLVIVVGLSISHWYGGASAEDSIRMTISDFRVAVECPDKPDIVMRFVRRNALEATGVALAERFGVDWVEDVCGGTLEL